MKVSKFKMYSKMTAPLEDDVMEEREELMASATGGIPQMRIAHFLKPNIPSIEASNMKLPYLSPKSKWPLQVDFNGWRDPFKKWEKWVELMRAKHQSSWKKAGIFEAIMCSKYRFHKNDDLVFGIAERWCSETNTFVFPWGEATITLEDIMILGGFSVLGSPVLLPVSENELVEIEKSLKNVHNNFVRMKRHNHLQWLNFYMDSGRRYEHEAFLSLWLSRFVFPGNEFDQIGEHVFPVAVHLARGTRIALGPAVLGCIYRDLSLLKESMIASSNLEKESGEASILALSLWAPLQLIQLWAWERFLMFRPQPNFLGFDEPRAARWHDVKKSDIGNVRPITDSAGEIFLWRPYTLSVDQWAFPTFYREMEERVQIGQCPDEALESFARCLRACVLIAIDCEEPYQPHRVSMQFGLDQDIPALVSRHIESLEVAWINYSKPLNKDASLYLPARLFESDLSIQYQQWWRKTVLVPVDSFRGILRGQRSSGIRYRDLVPSRQTGVGGFAGWSNTAVAKGQACTKKQIEVEGDHSLVPPGFPFRKNRTPNERIETSSKKQYRKEGNYPDVPPGFPPKKKNALMMRPGSPSKKQITEEGNNFDVPPNTKHALITSSEISSKKQTEGERINANAPSGFPLKTKHSPVMKLENSSKKQIKAEGSGVDVPFGVPSKTKRAPMMSPDFGMEQIKVEDKTINIPHEYFLENEHRPKMRPETSNKLEGKSADVPLGFPPKHKQTSFSRTETDIKQQIKVEAFNSNDPPLSPSKYNPSPPLVRKTSTKQQDEVEDFDLNPHLNLSPRLSVTLEQHQPRKGMLQVSDNHRNSNTSAHHELNSHCAFEVKVESSSAAAKKASIRTISTGNADSTGQMYKNEDVNLLYNPITINEDAGKNNCSFRFSAQILLNMQANMKRIRSRAGGL